MADLHHVSFNTGTHAQAGDVYNWVAKCTCGEQSDRPEPADGTMASARAWKEAHLSAAGPLPAGPAPVLFAGREPDAPDFAPDTYDAWLRDLTRGAR